MRTLIACVFNYSLDGLLANQNSDFLDYCLGLPMDPVNLEHQLDLYRTADAHIMGRTAYEGMAAALPTADHPFSPMLNAANKIVFSRTLKTAEWANTTIASGGFDEEVDQLRRGGDGHIVAWGGVTLWRSLIRLDAIDEFRFDLYPYVACDGTQLFEEVPTPYLLDLVSSTPSTTSGMLELHYRRRR